MKIEDPSLFLNELQSFWNAHGADGVDDLEWWLAKCQIARKNIRKRFGNNLQLKVNIETPDCYINKQLKLSSILHGCGDYHELESETIDSFITIGTLIVDKLEEAQYNNMSTTKYLSKHYDSFSGEMSVSEFQACCSILGSYYKMSKVSSGTYTMVLDTSAMGTLRLGHYGVDSNSCFKQCASSCIDKYNFGLIPDSFVGLLYDQNQTLIQRFLGFMYKDVFYLSNFYQQYEKHFSTVIYILTKIINHLIGDDVICYGSEYKMSDVYTNQFPRVVIGTRRKVLDEIVYDHLVEMGSDDAIDTDDCGSVSADRLWDRLSDFSINKYNQLCESMLIASKM